jgi:uncharacterized membrane protein YfcA
MSGSLFWVLLGFIGLFVGAFGTLIGAAGGFILVPVLLFLYPHETPATITSITLTVAFFNALSGSIAYGHLKRIDYRSGLLFSLAAVPGSILGATTTFFLSRGVFQYIFGAVLLLIAGYLIWRPQRQISHDIVVKRHVVRKITDSHNKVYTYSFARPRGMVIAFGVGFIGGLLGIGGGIMHVPALTQLLNFPTHVASATSHFVVAITTLAAIGTHVVTGAYTAGIHRALVLSAGAFIGAQFGARLSQRVSGTFIIRLLSIGLALVALRLLIAPF